MGISSISSRAKGIGAAGRQGRCRTGIQEIFSKGKGAAFLPYVCCGDPSAGFTIRLIETLAASGADAVELGIPFSDPVADGPVLQAASSRAIAAGMTPSKALALVAQLRRRGVELPIFIMAYCNTFYSQGVRSFLRAAKKAGADGAIVPDLPLGESGDFRRECANAGLAFVPLVSPGCSSKRIRAIARKAKGFLYAVSVAGTTGARKKVAQQSLELVGRAKKASGMPVAVGFGVSAPAHARLYARLGADGVIVGSHLAEMYSKSIGKGRAGEKRALAAAAAYCRQMKRACSGF